MRKWLSVEFAVGSLALAGLLAMIFLSIEVNDRGSIRGATRSVSAYFDTAMGLIPKTGVEVAGIAVGIIESISLEEGKAKLVLRLRKDLKLYQDASLQVKDRGVLGDKVLVLNPGSEASGLLSEGQVITNTESGGGIDELADTLSDTAKSLKEAMQSDDPEGALGQTILNLRDATGNIKDIIASNEARIEQILLNIDQLTADIAHMTKNNREQVGELITAMKSVAESLNEKLSDGGDLAEASEKLNNTLGSAEAVMAKIDRGEGTIGKLVNDDSTVTKLNDAIDNVNQTLGLVSRIQLNMRFRSEFLSSDKEFQNMIALTIAPSPDRYILLEAVSAPRGLTTVRDTEVISGGNTISSVRTVQTNDNVLFNILMGKRFWNATIKAGMLRNRGGLGLDYHFLKDRLSLSVEGFDFSRYNDNFHLRAFANLILYRHFILTAGADDLITNTGRRNFFGGIGIQFNDSDFRALVPAVGRAF